MSAIVQDASQVSQKLANKLTQVGAFLVAMYGENAEAFNDMSKTTKDNFIWGVADLVRDCESMAEALNAAIHRDAKQLVVEVSPE